MRILLILLVFFTIFSLAAGKGKGKGGKGKGKPKPTKPSEGTTLAPGGGKGKGKPKPPKPTEPPIITIVEEDEDACIICLMFNGGGSCIEMCDGGDGKAQWRCKQCIATHAPMCLRPCGFHRLQDKLSEMANPILRDPCVMINQALPLVVGGVNAVSSTTPDIFTADACGQTCKGDNESQGWTWANENDNSQFKYTCWCLKNIGMLTPDIARDSSPIAACPQDY